MGNRNIVVWDPEGVYWEGALVDDRRAVEIGARGVALLPVQPELFVRSGVGGFHKRAWGSGWPLDTAAPRTFCPLAIYCARTEGSQPRMHWALRLMPVSARAAEGGVDGFVQLISDASQHNPLKLVMQHSGNVDMRKLGAPDMHGGWTVTGSNAVLADSPGHYPVAFHGHAPGLRALWAAVSLA